MHRVTAPCYRTVLPHRATPHVTACFRFIIIYVLRSGSLLGLGLLLFMFYVIYVYRVHVNNTVLHRLHRLPL